MKTLFILSLFVSLLAQSQMMNGSRFIYSALTVGTPQDVIDAGTVSFIRQKFTNDNNGVTNGNGLTIEGTGNITIKNCLFYATSRKGIGVWNFTGTVLIENCFFVSNETAIEVFNTTGNVTVKNCWTINPYGAKRCQGQFIQVEESDPASCLITGNKMQVFRGEGYTEDWISLYVTNGTSGSPVRVSYNTSKGGGPSDSGGGFMFGDTGGSWQIGEFNKLYKPGNYIMAISNGTNIALENNKGYQPSEVWSNIGMYGYKVVAGHACSDLTVQNNDIFIRNDVGSNNMWFAGEAGEECGDIIGIDEGGTEFLETNTDDLTEAELNIPTDLIDCVSTETLWELRDLSVPFRDITETCAIGTWPADLHRPTSLAGSDQNININNTTFAGSSTSSNGATYRWVQVSGPNVATITTPTSATSTVTGLIDGVYEFRLEVTDDDGASDGDFMTITVLLT